MYCSVQLMSYIVSLIHSDQSLVLNYTENIKVVIYWKSYVRPRHKVMVKIWSLLATTKNPIATFVLQKGMRVRCLFPMKLRCYCKNLLIFI